MAGQGGAKARVLFLVGACLLLAAVFAYRAAGFREPVSSTQFMMDTVVEQRAYGQNAEEAVRQAEALLRELEREQSLFLSDSEVAAINAGAGIEPVAVSARTFEMIRLAAEFAAASDGDFDVTTAPLKELWNITGENPRIPEQSEIDAVLPLVNYRDIVLDTQKQTVLLQNKGQEIDLGGVAKGYAAGLCVELYRALGVTGYINVGGNVAVAGEKPGGKQMNVGIRSPRGDAPYFGKLELGDNILATSGDYERFFESGGVRYHHILDPKTGRPAQSDLISVSVVSQNGAQADFLSTALFIRGRNGLDSLQGLYSYEYVAVDREQNVYVSPGLRDKFRLSSEAGGYHFIS